MVYQIAKDIGAMCVVLKGAVDGIILMGGMAHSEMPVGEIEKWVSFLAPVFVFPGEDEMTALAEGGLRVLLKEEEIRKYSLKVLFETPCSSGRHSLFHPMSCSVEHEVDGVSGSNATIKKKRKLTKL